MEQKDVPIANHTPIKFTGHAESALTGVVVVQKRDESVTPLSLSIDINFRKLSGGIEATVDAVDSTLFPLAGRDNGKPFTENVASALRQPKVADMVK